MELLNKVVVITGGSSGIGRALAVKLGEKGARLALLGRNEERLAEVSEELKQKQVQVLTVTTDVTDPGMVWASIMATIQQFGQIDVLINCAGIGYFGALENMTDRQVESLVQTNVLGLLRVTREAIPYLRKTHGMVVNISSGLSKRALPYLSAYAGTKSMVDALSEGLRLELKPDNIHVLNYCPPETATDFFQNAESESGLLSAMSQRKMAQPEQVACRIVKAIEKEKREVVQGRFLEIMNFFAPRLLDKMFYKGIVEKLNNRPSK